MQVRFKGIIAALFIICCSSCSDPEVNVGIEEDHRPVWVLTEGYGDEHFYSVGTFGGNLEERISEKVNSAQLDAVNKLRVQIRGITHQLVYSWADSMSDYQRTRISDTYLEQMVEGVLTQSLNKAHHVQTWTDPLTQDLYVLIQVKFNDLSRVMKNRVSRLIVQASPDNSRQAHAEFERQVSALRKTRSRN